MAGENDFKSWYIIRNCKTTLACWTSFRNHYLVLRFEVFFVKLQTQIDKMFLEKNYILNSTCILIHIILLPGVLWSVYSWNIHWQTEIQINNLNLNLNIQHLQFSATHRH